VIGYNKASKSLDNGAQYKYKLTSMVVHLGGSQHGGHYVACGEGGNGTMYEFDDCSVSWGLSAIDVFLGTLSQYGKLGRYFSTLSSTK